MGANLSKTHNASISIPKASMFRWMRLSLATFHSLTSVLQTVVVYYWNDFALRALGKQNALFKTFAPFSPRVIEEFKKDPISFAKFDVSGEAKVNFFKGELKKWDITLSSAVLIDLAYRRADGIEVKMLQQAERPVVSDIVQETRKFRNDRGHSTSVQTVSESDFLKLEIQILKVMDKFLAWFNTCPPSAERQKALNKIQRARDEAVVFLQSSDDIKRIPHGELLKAYRASTTMKPEECIPELLRLGIDLDAVMETGQTLLITASLDGNAKWVKQLLKYGASPLKRWHDKTALYYASANGKLEVVKALLDHKPAHGLLEAFNPGTGETAVCAALEYPSVVMFLTDFFLANEPRHTAWDPDFLVACATAGYETGVTKLLSIARPSTINTAAGDWFVVIDPIYGPTNEYNSSLAIVAAAENGRDKIVKTLCESKHLPSLRSMETAYKVTKVGTIRKRLADEYKILIGRAIEERLTQAVALSTLGTTSTSTAKESATITHDARNISLTEGGGSSGGGDSNITNTSSYKAAASSATITAVVVSSTSTIVASSISNETTTLSTGRNSSAMAATKLEATATDSAAVTSDGAHSIGKTITYSPEAAAAAAAAAAAEVAVITRQCEDLCHACEVGDLQTVSRLLIIDNANPNCIKESIIGKKIIVQLPTTSMTALMRAALGGYFEIVKLLLDHGAGVRYCLPRHCPLTGNVTRYSNVFELLGGIRFHDDGDCVVEEADLLKTILVLANHKDADACDVVVASSGLSCAVHGKDIVSLLREKYGLPRD